jgi:high affinity Mn2+ porin
VRIECSRGERRRRLAARFSIVPIAVASLGTSTLAFAQPLPPAPHEDTSFDIMNELSHRGLHDIKNETWNLYGQFSYITSVKPSMNAPYTNVNGSPNSLWPEPERGFTSTLTLFGGLALWPGAAAYVVPEFIAERAFSDLHGLGGSTENFELQKTGAASPTLYRSRLFLQQTIDLGGDRVVKDSNPLQLGTVVKSQRLVITAGNFSVLDIFDRNTIVGDLRQSFFNEAFMTHASFDFPADSRGYTYGAAVELYLDDWAVRLGRFSPPLNPNSYEIDPRIWKFYGDEIEIEHDHTIFGQDGVIRLLAYRNYEDMGAFNDAIAAFERDPQMNAASCTSYNYGSGNFTAPDLCWVRHGQSKLGIGLNFEQNIAQDIGVFGRVMYSDGRTEVDAFDSADRDASLGIVAKGTLWQRPLDVTGVGAAVTWISGEHARYLNMGGIDAFIGDGKLPHDSSENLFEVFYSYNFFRAIWLSADYQFLMHPAYNSDRGPENVFSGRVHAEF